MKVILYMAVSIDGIAALDEKTGIERYGSSEDRDFFLAGAKACDAVIMGKNTAALFKVYGLPNFVLTHDKNFSQAQKTAGADGTKAQDGRGFERDGSCSRLTRASFCERVCLSGEPREICAALEARGIKTAALLGGPSTSARFLKAGLVDEFFLTVEPVTIGRGLRFLDEPLESRWILAGTKKLNKGGTLVLHYKKIAR